MAEERKLATILFADLAGSTALADEQDPERTRARLERFYDAMAAEIEAAGGTVEKFAGDAVMAAFGAPEALEDHAERALHTAFAMQRRLESGLAIRIGVNTGEVVVRRARESSSFVSGDAVNVAARLEQGAEPGEILAGERTVGAARGPSSSASRAPSSRARLARGSDPTPGRPPENSPFLGAFGPQSYTPDMAVSRRTVTVLFADVADSTPLGERLDPESLRRVMSGFFERMSSVLERHGGTVEKFIGDAVMAVFGIPELHEDDALRAVRAATELRQALSQLNDELERDLAVRIGIRVGINTGEVVAGDGSGGQMLATGDAVNVAKRLEESARTGEILLGEPTRRLVENAVVLEPREDLTLKGKTDPQPAWNVLAVIEGASAYARRLDAPLIGREAEMHQLRNTYNEAVTERSCRMFTVVGPAGIGKSRLAGELCATLRDEATILTGRCLNYGDGITFWPLVEIVGALGSDEGVLEALGDTDDAELVATRVLGAVGTNPTAPGGETFWAVRRLFEELARERPLVVLVEDIHWAEPTLLDLLEYLAGWTHDAPVLLLCLTRPDLLDERPGWLTQTGGGVILEPLTDEQSRELLDEIAQEWSLDAAAREHITEAAEGNPLYLEQMAAMLAEGGPTDGIPPTIHALIAARLDRLPADERAVLESAAVAGKHFVRSALRRLLGEADQSAVDASLLSLARKDLLTARPGREDAYRFRHVLIRDAAYAGIAKELRAQLHERYADWAANTRAGKAGDVDEIVGYHLEQAVHYRKQLGQLDEEGRVLADRSAFLLGAAGRRAFARDDAPAAVNLLDRALALATNETPAELELIRQLSTSLWSIGEVARAEALLQGLIDAAVESGDRRYELYGSLQRVSWRFSREEATWEEVTELAEEAIETFEAAGDDFGLAQAWRQLASALHARSRFGEGVEAAERALQHARRAEAAREEARAVDLLCMCLVHGPTPVSVAAERASTMLADAQANPGLKANVMAALAELKAMQKSFETARELLAEARRTYEQLGLRLALVGLMQVGGAVELLAGEADEAEHAFREGLELLAVELPTWRAYQAGLLAEALYDQGRYDEAGDLVDSAEAYLPEELEYVMPWVIVKARLLARAGASQEGESLLRDLTARAAKTDALNVHGRLLLALAEVLLTADRTDDARQVATEAAAIFERKGNLPEAERAASLVSEPAPR
jgi:class 3 adenylate cyclase/tetratricopeptide (TPR) repeat protein